jgi:hypothetical protein
MKMASLLTRPSTLSQLVRYIQNITRDEDGPCNILVLKERYETSHVLPYTIHRYLPRILRIYPEDGSYKLLRDVDKYLTDYTASSRLPFIASR